ncbi:M16 family metallopeptidase [Caulobacter vibrioides]|uniref:M16 family metallopeptidase n=1 Tax=Caulobacter vibrioides TaxID=155892 RepID=UPI0015E641AD|nr:M16 family metallopeptidase [Caulobacter vibrioides]
MIALAQSKASCADEIIPQKRVGVWAQTYSDVVPDPSLRFGVLANGLRYVIRPAVAPGKRVALRLAFAVGSIDERSDELGFAHLLEHMAFRNGGGQTTRELETAGLVFGPDLNALTYLDKTVYQVNLPRNDPRMIGTALTFLSEASRASSIDAAALAREKEVVLAEGALRDTVAERAEAAFRRALPTPQLALERPIIPSAAQLRNATASKLTAFKSRLYTPDRGVVVVVGAEDPDGIVRMIEQRFGDWRAPPAPVRPDLALRPISGARAFTHVEKGLSRSVRLVWSAPYDSRADTVARERRDLQVAVAIGVVNDRLDAISLTTDAPFFDAHLTKSNDAIRGLRMQLEARSADDHWPVALSRLVAEHRRMLTTAPTSAEVSRVLARFRLRHETRLMGLNSEDPANIADHLVELAADNEVATSALQNRDRFLDFSSRLDVAAVQKTYAELFGSGPTIMLFGSQQESDAVNRAAKIYADAAAAAPSPALEALGAPKWPFHVEGGTLAKVTERKLDETFGVTVATLDNGIRILVKKTDFVRDEILVSIRLRRGVLDLPADRPSPLWLASTYADGGTKALTLTDAWRAAPGAKLSAAFRLTETGSYLSGVTRAADLDRQLELLSALVSQPAFREGALERRRTEQLAELDTLFSKPAGVYLRDVPRLLHSGDQRWSTLPTAVETAAVSAKDVREFFDPILASGVADVTIIGDVEVDAALDAARATIGRFPSIAVPISAVQPAKFPAPSHLVAHHEGAANQSMIVMAWPTLGAYVDPKRSRAIGLAAALLRTRLTDRLRTKEGLVYGVFVSTAYSAAAAGHGQISISAEATPQALDQINQAILEEVARLASEGPAADELERAKQPLRDGVEREERSNGFWVTRLFELTHDARARASFVTRRQDLDAITAQQVQAAVSDFMIMTPPWTMRILPPQRATKAH